MNEICCSCLNQEIVLFDDIEYILKFLLMFFDWLTKPICKCCRSINVYRTTVVRWGYSVALQYIRRRKQAVIVTPNLTFYATLSWYPHRRNILRLIIVNYYTDFHVAYSIC